MIKLVIFDVDGVLIDSGDALYLLYRDCLKKLGIKKRSREEILKFNGHTAETWTKKLLPEISKETFDEVIRRTEKAYPTYIQKFAKPAKNIKEVLEELHKKVKLGIVTNQNMEQIRTSLRKIGFDKFDIIIAGTDTTPKPSGKPILKAIEKIGCKKSETICVGDTEVDVEAGKAAGVRTIIINREWNKELNYNDRISSPRELLEVVKNG